MANFFDQFDAAPASAPAAAPVPTPIPRPAANFFDQFDEEQGPPMPPRPANVPLPPPRPGDLGIGAQEFPPVQPLAGEAPAVAPRDLDGNLREQEFDANGIPVESSTDPQSIPTAPGGKNNLVNRLYKKLGIDPRSVMDTGVAYDQQVQKREEAAQGLEEARANTEKEARLEDEKIRRLERAAAEGNTFARDQLAIMRSHQGQQPTVTEDAQYAQEKARTAKVTEDLRSPAIVNPGRNALESVPKTIANQAVDTASAASRIVDKVFEPIDRLIGTDVKANDKKREDYWERRRRAVDGAFNTDPALAGTFGQQVVDGIASTAGFMGAGLVGRAVGLGATATTAVAGAFPQGEQHWRMLDDWYKLHPEQDSQWKRWTNFAIGLGSGATEAAPIGHLFQRLETLGKGGLTRVLGIAAAQGGEEGMQEALQQIIQNAASRGFMDPRTPLTEDMVNSFLTAAASGALMGGGGAAIARSMQKGPDGRPVPNLAPAPEAPPELPAELQPGAQAPAEPPVPENAAPAPVPVEPVPAAPAGAEGAVPSAPAPQQQEAAPAAPAAPEEVPAPPPAPVSQATPDEAKLLLGAGYTAQQIAEMGRTEIEAAAADEREAGTKPVETLPPELLPQNEATSAPPSTPAPASETATSEAVSAPPLATAGQAAATSTPVQTARVEAGEGTRAKPVKAEGPEDAAVAAAQADPNPTPAQAEQGNYRHGHLKFDGFDIAIENAKGSTRSGTDPDGNAWSTQMPAHYGRLKGTKGADGDQVDVYVGDKPPNGKVFVVDQFDPKTGRFDEVKSIMGVDSVEEALAIYDGGFSDGSGPQRFGGIREVSTDYFRSWLNSPSRSKRPFTPEGRAKAAGKEPPPPVKAFLGDKVLEPTKSPAQSGASSSEAPAAASEHRPKDPVAGAFFDHLVSGGSFPNILQARKMAKEQGVEDVKAVEEAMELAVVSAAKVAIFGKSEAEAFDALVDLYGRQPRLNTRTSTSVRDQAYSTPIPLAYVAQRLAQISQTDFVYEPTAGNGALLFTADPDRVVANELNKGRADNLEAQGYTVTEHDASAEATREKVEKVLHGQKPDVVIGNPPFGTVQEDGRPKVFDLNSNRAGYETTQIDHAIVVRTLGMMKPDGRAVFIVGAPGKQSDAAEAYHGQRKRAFFKFLWDHYNVADHFTVGGNLYARQGTQWPVDVIVIDGRGKTERPLPAVTPPPVLTSWDQVKEKLDGRDRPDVGRPAEAAAGDGRGTAPSAVRSDRGSAGPRELAGRDPEPRQPEGVREPAVQPEPESPASTPSDDAGRDRPGASGQPAGPTSGSPAKRRPPRVENADEAFDAAFDQLFGEQKPVAAPQAAPATQPGRRADTRTPGQIVKSAATETAMGLDDALSGLYQLFGGGKTIGSGPVFDEETYAKAKPLFIAAAQHLKNAAKDLVALARAIMQSMIDRFGEQARDVVQRMRPYITRFMGDVKDGKIDLNAQPQQQEQPKAPEEKAGDQPAAPKQSAPQEKETDKQVAYTPTSQHGGLGTLVPVNMQTAIQNALEKIAAEHESVDKFVAEELGYVPGSEAFHNAFAAEQVDALALAITNIKKGAALILGDQTGVGKGRVNAGVIRWAIKNGMTPIFVTEKPNLYGDMYRDLRDIGTLEFLGREPRLLMTNVPDRPIPLNVEALDSVSERELAKQLGQPLPAPRGLFLTSPASKQQEQRLKAFAAAGDIGEHDVVFTTYNQMQSVGSKEPERVRFLRAVAPNAVVIFDESHNAGGQEGKPRVAKDKPAPIPRSKTARELVSLAKAVFYSSATFAKRPSVMDLYSKTDMRLAVSDIEKLAQAIKDGGVPMQQVVSTMLAEAGQYIRRERSFDGVVYDTPVVDVDREKYNEFAGALQSILEFSRSMKGAVAEIDQTIRAEAESVARDESTGEAGAESLNFTAIMHNLISQYLLAAKVDIAADRAIQALRNGEKPVLTVASTLESFLSEFAADNDLKPGMPIELDFSQLLIRYLDRTRTITIKDAYKNKRKHYLTDEELGPEALEDYESAKQYIKDLDFGDLPISPIDWIHFRLKKEGYTTGEITGRGMVIDYKAPGKGVLRARSAREVSPSGRLQTIAKFNNEVVEEVETSPGTFVQKRKGISTIILNQAGSTGLSLHTNATFVNRQKRVMFIVQPEANIDTHMQTLGRVHRTGQVVLPRYEQLIGNVPAEKRPAAVLQKKMASLNASTTASREGALTGKDVPDFINQYGDIVAKQWLEENTEIAPALGDLQLGEQKKEADPTEDGAMRKLTGRIPLLDLDLQETVYDDLEQRYADLIEQLEATGMNALEAKALDLDARQLESVTLREGQGDSPFDGPATLGIFDIKRQGKPVTGAEVLAALARAVSSYDKDNADYYASLVLGAGTDKRKVAQAVDAINNRVRKRDKARMEEALKAGRAYIDQLVAAEEDEDKKQATRARLLENLDRFELLMRQLDPGHKVRMVLPDGEAYTGIVIKVDHGGKAKNPLALGTWRATIAVPLNNPMVPVSLASLQTGDEDGKIKLEDAAFEPLDATLDLFDQLAAGGAREKRIIATGNILAAFSSLKGKGQIISFTDHQGRKQPGIMMPAKLKKLTDITDTLGRPLTTPMEVMEFIASKFGTPIFDTARNLEILSTGYEFTVRTPADKRKGGRYYLDPAVLQALGRDFTKIGPWMRVVVNAARGPAIVEALLKAGASFEAPPVKKQKPIATQQRVAEPAPAAPSLTPEGGRVAQMVRDIVAQVVGTQNVRLQTPERAYSQDAEASQRSGGPAATGQEISGSVQQFISAKPIITIALAQNPDAVAKTTFHEAFHVLQGYQALTPQEREIMRREYPRMLDIIERTGRSTTTMSGSEVEAYAFEIYASARRAGRPAPAGLHIAVRRAFERLLQIITRIGNKLRGLGYRSADDVFAAAFTGEIGARIGTEAQVARRAESPMRGVAYSTFSPETQRDLEAYNLSVGRTPAAQRPPPPSSFQESKPGIEEGALRKLQDDFVPLRRYQQDITSQIGDIPEGRDAYLAAEAYRNRAAARLEDFKKDHVDPLIEEMLKADVGDELGVALLARHAVERNQFIEQRDPTNTAGSYLDSAAAQQIIADMQASGMWQKLLPLMDRVYAMIEADRRVRLAAGLISQQTYNDWKGRFQHYVPLQGSMAEDETEADGFSTGWGFDVRGRESQIAYGRWTIPNNPLHNVIAQAQAGIIRAEKNRVDRALLKLAQAYPNPDLWKVNERRYVPALEANGRKIMVVDHSLRHQPNVLGVKVAGKVHYITLKDMQLAEAFRLLPTDVARSAFTRGVGQLTRAYAQLQTGKNLEFFIRNVPRDLQEALFTLFVEDPRLLPSFVKSFPRSTQVAVEQALGVNRWISPRNQALYDEFRRNGGQMSFSAYRDTATIADEVNEALGGLGKFTLAKLPGMAAKVSWRVIHTLYLKWVGAINEGFENATRLAVYMAARENGYSPAKAARMAREATVNFSRRGQWTTAISAYKMFFNPNVQGNVKTLRMLMGERDATPAQQSRARRARVLYAALPTLGFMLTLWNAAAGGDDEDEKRPGKRRLKYMGIPDYERDGNMIFIYGSHEVNGKRLPKYIKIPKSFGLGIPITLGEQMALMMLGQQTPTGAAAATMRSIMGVFNPLGSQNPFEKGFWINQVAPTLATPAVDMTMNRDWTGRPIVPPDRPWNAGEPRSSQYFSTTSPAAIDAARWLRDKTGVDIYPGHIQYSVNWVTGGAGRFYKSTWDAAANAAAGVPTPLERMPLLKQFMGKVDTAAEQDLYYKNRQDAVERFNKVNAAKRTLERFPTDESAKRDFIEGSRDLGLGFKNGRFVRKGSLLEVYDEKEIKALRDRINAIRRDQSRPLAEREKQVTELRNQMDTAMRRARRGAASYPAYQNQ